jgi:PIN domain nuclease of toxin-antitoxin system
MILLRSALVYWIHPSFVSTNSGEGHIDKEILEKLIHINGQLQHHDLHDKIILASAMVLSCKLITNDPKIIGYIDQTQVIPEAINWS